MRIDVADIVKQEGAVKHVHVEGDLSGQDSEGLGFSLSGTTIFDGTVSHIGGVLHISGKVSSGYKTECALCLKGLEGTAEVDMFVEFLPAEKATPDDEDTFTGNDVDISRAVFETVALTVPVKPVCSENCRGLCPNCGKDLNEGGCACDTAVGHPGFDALKKFFDKN